MAPTDDLLGQFQQAEAHAVEMERRANQAALGARNARREAERLREQLRDIIDPPAHNPALADMLEKAIRVGRERRKGRPLTAVLYARRFGPGGSGCCDRYANNMACDCLTEAADREGIR